ncbi:MAG TPA: hypothetical protein VLW45_11115 [Pelomicrobium sp.]|nr:hypothetical protein [Pelomicrobium sp.]
MTLFEALQEHLALSLAKQEALSDWLGEHSFAIDAATGTVDFGRGRGVPRQILGFESEGDNAWTWAWADASLPDEVMLDAERLREFGQRHELRLLTDPVLPLADAGVHALALLASGVCGADAYYRGPAPGGAVFVLLQETPLDLDFIRRPERVATVLARAVQLFDVDHRAVTRSWMRTLDLEIETVDGRLVGSRRGEPYLEVTFDAAGRMQRIGTAKHAE